MAKSKTYPGFFVVHIPKLTSQRLVIPPAFIARIDKVVPDKTMLRNRLGRLWQVEVVKTDTSVYFLNGWEKFVKDNRVNAGEFIVFQYNGDCIFYVKLLGRHGCLKEDVGASASIGKRTSFVKEEEDEERKCCEKQKQKVIEEEDDDDGDFNCYKEDDVDDGDDDDDDDDDEEEEEEEEDDDDNYVVVEEEEDEDDEGDKEEETKAFSEGRKKKGLLDSDGCKVTDDVNISGQNEETQPVKAKNCDGVDVEKYVDPANPYFVSRLLANRVKLYVPTDVIEDFNIQLHPKMKMFLRDPMGREWPGEVVVWKDGRVWIGGWNKLYKWNRVTQDDKCICEFMLDRGNLIKVHIVRAGQT